MPLLDNRVAIVTGSGRGIGAAVARRLAAEGASVVVNDLGVQMDGSGPSDSPAHEVVQEIVGSGGSAVADFHDVASFDDARELVQTAIRTFGKLDVLVNVAGILRDRMIFNMEEDEWDAVIRVHLKGTFNTCRWASSYWRELRQPDAHHRIINFSSGSGLFGKPDQPNYAAAKMGIIGLTYSCAALDRYGVTANAICPMANTRMQGDMPADMMEALGPAWTSGELAPDNVTPVIVYLAGEQSDWVNGWVFGSWGHQLTLYSNPDTMRQIASPGPWQMSQLAQLMEETFKPAVQGYVNPARETRQRQASTPDPSSGRS